MGFFVVALRHPYRYTEDTMEDTPYHKHLREKWDRLVKHLGRKPGDTQAIAERDRIAKILWPPKPAMPYTHLGYAPPLTPLEQAALPWKKYLDGRPDLHTVFVVPTQHMKTQLVESIATDPKVMVVVDPTTTQPLMVSRKAS